MKPLYLETTIPSYLIGRPSRDLLVAAHQEITRDWWGSRRSQFELYVSEFVAQEVRAGDALLASHCLELLRDVPRLAFSSEILKLAAHIAIATVYGCEYLLTWNCRHIANAELRRAIRRVVEHFGTKYRACAPQTTKHQFSSIGRLSPSIICSASARGTPALTSFPTTSTTLTE